MKLTPAMLGMLEIAVNRALRLDPETQRRLQALTGKVIGIELRGVNIQFFLSPQADGVQLLGEYHGDVHTWIRGAPFALLRSSLSEDRSAIYSGEVKIEGDLDIGQRVQYILRNVQIDWEEPLAKTFGDVIGHQIGETARNVFKFAKNAISTLGLDAAEYFKEERRDLVTRYEVDQFCRGVDHLRLDTDRLELRIQRLKDRMSGSIS